MCGHLKMIDDLFIRVLIQDLGVSNPSVIDFERFKIPTNKF